MSQLSSKISQFWGTIQTLLLPWLEEELLPLTDQQRKLIAILEMIRLEEFIPPSHVQGADTYCVPASIA